MSLPTDSGARNALPIWDGLIAYFPDVWAEIAKVSVKGARQHHLPKLGWDTHVSTDHRNKVLRHMLDDAFGAPVDADDCYHLAKAIWRLCAQLQLRCWERDGKDAHGEPLVVRCSSCGAFGGAHFGDCDGETRCSGSEETSL